MNIVLITGASSGLGNEFARQLDKEIVADQFWLIARRKDRLEELENQLHHVCRLFPLDLSKTQSFQILKNALETANRDSKLQILWLVNGAGLGYYGNVSDLTPEQIQTTIQLNCMALTSICHLTAPYLGKGSTCINIASLAAFFPQPGFSVYAASKSYVYSVSLALSREFKALKVQVTTLCPGPVQTEFFSTALKAGQTIPEYKKRFMADAKDVVRTAIGDAKKKRSISIYGFPMKLVWFASKILPHKWILKLLY